MADRFWPKVAKGDGCWLWTAAKGHKGYGSFEHHNAHRIAYQLEYGPIPDGLFVLHRCDNPPCCRPDHLFLGTNADNMRDAFAKGRIKRLGLQGERNHRAKLSAADVLEMRRRFAAGESRQDILRDHLIHKDHLNGILRRRTWKSI
jgi:hypothetical protein